jgi:hypothetical protein
MEIIIKKPRIEGETVVVFDMVNGCPVMTATKGNMTFVFEGMDFIFEEIIIKHENGKIEKITDSKKIMEIYDETFTERENREISKYCWDY